MFELTPEATLDRARYHAGALVARGLRPGDRVAVVSGNHPEFLPFTMGALCTGVVPVLVNVHLGSAERERILDDADVAAVVTDQSWPVAHEGRVDLAPYPLGRPMHYTSGTTGRSKGVWSGVFSAADAQAHALDERELWNPHPDEAVLVCSPLYHSAPHRIALSALLAGASVLVFERFEAAAVAEAFSRVSGAFLVPTHLRRLLDGPFSAPAARRILHAGEPCPEELKLRALEAFPDGCLWEFYGSTEGQFTACPPEDWLAHRGTVGRARAGRELSVAAPGADGVGTVYVTAPSFARWSYWRDPDRTEQAWDGDAFTVGDLGRLDADEFLYLVGRREDLIITGAVNVYPAEVERVLVEHASVDDVAVFGVPDPEWGQRVCAAVVGRDVDVERLRAWARERLPGSHVPKTIRILDALPRTATGKVRRSGLAQAD